MSFLNINHNILSGNLEKKLLIQTNSREEMMIDNTISNNLLLMMSNNENLKIDKGHTRKQS